MTFKDVLLLAALILAGGLCFAAVAWCALLTGGAL